MNPRLPRAAHDSSQTRVHTGPATLVHPFQRALSARPVVAVLVALMLVAGLLVNFRFALGAGATPVATDTFGRTVVGGWGSAQVGGAWTVIPSSAFSVDNGSGHATLASDGVSPRATLDAVSSSDTDLTTTFSVDKVATGSGVYVSAIGRSVVGAGEYDAKVHLRANGTVAVSLARRNAALTESSITAETTVSGLTTTAGSSISVRLHVAGTATTALQARVWASGTTEPTTWTISATDATAALQKPGGVGVSGYLSRGATNAPVTVSVSSLSATTTASAPAPRPAPVTPAPPTVSGPTVSGSRASSTAGAVTIGSARYPYPSTAVFVAPRGSDSTGNGSAAKPFFTVAKAAGVAKAGGTIVLRGGTYHQSVFLPGNKALVLQSYPGEAVWFDGRRVVTAVASGKIWRVDGWTSVFDHSPTYSAGKPDNTTAFWSFINAAHPMASHPEQVFIGGTKLRQVGALSQVVAGTFFIDTAGKHIYIGSNPAGQVVRSSDLQIAIHVSAAGTILRGFGVRGYATSVPQMGAVRIFGASTTVENVAVIDNATQGLMVGRAKVTLRHVTAQGNGLLGIQANYADGLRVSGLRSVGNNAEQFNMSPVSGGIKVTRSRGLVVVNSVVSSNLGNGVWFDESSYNITVLGNDISGNLGNGIITELSQRVLVANNVVRDNGKDGYVVADTGAVQIWNNSFARNNRNISMYQDTRSQFNLANAGHDPRQTLPDATVPWRLLNVTVHNNIFDNGKSNALLRVEDVSHRYSAEAMQVAVDGNVYLRATAAKPTWAVIWSRGASSSAAFASVAAFRAATAQEDHGLGRDGNLPTPITAASTAASALPLPAALAPLIGRATGVRHFGAW
jgi:parallel beta-helix repeat protein